MKTSGIYSEIFLHFIWATKLRSPTLTDDNEQVVKMICAAKAKELNLQIIEIEGAYDHLHVLLRSNQSICPADIAKHLKGSSSHYVNHVAYPRDFNRFYWQDGYGVVSVSPDAVESVARYIRNQKAHHREGDVIPEFENPGNQTT